MQAVTGETTFHARVASGGHAQSSVAGAFA